MYGNSPMQRRRSYVYEPGALNMYASPVSYYPSSPVVYSSPSPAAPMTSSYQRVSASPSPSRQAVVSTSALDVDFHAALTTGVARRQEHARAQELVDIRDSVVELLRQFESDSKVEPKFDESPIVQQIDSALPPVINEALNEDDKRRAASEPGRYEQLEQLRNQVQSMAESADPDFAQVFDLIASRVSDVLNVYAGTRNQDGEEEVMAALRALVQELATLQAIEVPDTRELKAKVQVTDAKCGDFEDRRGVVDWTEELTQAEGSLYSEVDTAINQTARQAKQSAELLGVLHSMRALSLSINEVKPAADRARIRAGLESVRTQEAEEERKFEAMSANLESQLATAKSEHDNHVQTVAKLEEHIRRLMDDLSDAYLGAHRSAARMNAVSRSINLLVKKQRLNQSLAEHEEEVALRLLHDTEAHIDAASKINDVLRSASETFHAVRAQRESKVVTEVVDLSIARLNLIIRKYFKTALSVYAAESSVEMLEQEREALLKKKARSNAAQKFAWVADCNKALADLQGKVEYEEANKARANDDLRELEELFDEIHEQASSLALAPIHATWVATRDELKQIEARRLSQVELDNRLDAGFLSQM
ncbi:uncharacterized protein AMSG_10052 [Thecamonas trahens ATCC 50062]|uniref:Uncharacterized protein n=1 Tax=Thecamonas trahens ATCC 50062 TaxID=461836 RepID=A0A0L0DQF2_THETB|nr:hypothetical protein AMSG_10052 [Thecamonas trahens ATCC 50062]KNC54256.1 hypothetical protein AMSG_10052 [Thecamonas trahens ATCC 50062]|eukprot:XP_013753891.1 hypothetical protein AMSG_10052 [Thecamonas trahens ATCC 50062]